MITVVLSGLGEVIKSRRDSESGLAPAWAGPVVTGTLRLHTQAPSSSWSDLRLWLLRHACAAAAAAGPAPWHRATVPRPGHRVTGNLNRAVE